MRVTICHCTFCQRLTGSAYLVEPIFRREDVIFHGTPLRTYDHQSDTSGKRVTVNFCGRCATTICLDLERFPDILGLCGGTFDDPNWFDRGQENCRHIFTRSAQRGVVLPAGCEPVQGARARARRHPHPADHARPRAHVASWRISRQIVRLWHL
ncbi:GFA family protein [Bradyrhizobium sp. AZCC 1620]|uniref:GFA family protein n=1 Tax=Bradyrhizobium sp. AZCC 1620 TaxID=3117023 RepID=UPI003FA5CF26